MSASKPLKGRGSSINPHDRFSQHHTVKDAEHLGESEEAEELLYGKIKTKYIEVQCKTIINKVDSPDLPDHSLNPYQGCEHGCSYCYARNTHEYWGYSAGTDFESTILVKKNAPQVLAKTISHPNWEAVTVMMAGNTDIYQPAEQQYKLTRALLDVFYRYRHPVGLITKNTLIERDLDILSKLNEQGLVSVIFSLTTLDEKLKRVMEPRTSTAAGILRAIEQLSRVGIPVRVLNAPLIPALNDTEIFQIAEAVSSAGAKNMGYQVVRLNAQVGVVFENWIRHYFPDRADKVLNHIRSMHGGTLNDSRFGIRMKGEGEWALKIKQMHQMAMKRYFPEAEPIRLNTSLHKEFKGGQLKLFS